MAEMLKAKVLFELQSLTEEQLEQICGTQNVTITGGKKSKIVALRNAMIRYLSSEEVEDSEDEGFALFNAVHEEVEKLIKQNPLSTEAAAVKDEEEDGSGKGVGSEMTERERKLKREYENPDQRTNPVRSSAETTIREYSKIKLKDFKIHGGTVGGAEGLDWNSLQYQMQKEGIELGYSQKEIMSGVIRAMKSGSSLRKYFEGKSSLKWESFTAVLKAHCNVVTASTLLDRMGECVQEPAENTLDYVLRMINMKDVVIETNKDEDCPIGTPHIKQKFTRAIDVGLRSPTVRLELKPLIYNQSILEDEFVEEVTKVMSRKEESDRKLGKTGKGGGKTAAVNQIDREEESKQDKMLAQLTKLTEIVVENQRHVEDLEKRMSDMRGNREGGQDKGGNKGGKKPFHFTKCAPCEKDKLFCTHCSICGEGGHKRHACPKNVK